jgi:hypothetical protein
MSEAITILQLLAPQLERLILRPEADHYYDLFAGAIIWMDERPSFDGLGEHHMDCVNAMRRVWFFRTALILGERSPQDEGYWLVVKQLFPSWLGFALERCSVSLRETVLTLRSKAREQFERDFDELQDP